MKSVWGLAAAAACFVASPAASAINYTLNTDALRVPGANPADSNRVTSFSFTTPDFLTSSFTRISAFDSCSVFSTPCEEISFYRQATDRVDVFGRVGLDIFYFDAGAITTLGIHQSILSLNNAGTTLTVTDTSAVPEPATWALMLVGFGAVGYGMRRRRTPVQAQA